MHCANRIALRATVIVIIMTALGSAGPARAAVVQNFDTPAGANGQVAYAADSFYLATGASPSGGDKNGNAFFNGLIIQNTAQIPNNPGYGTIGQDQSGSGYFLFDGTVNGGLPNYAGKFFEPAAAVPVLPNTAYQLSFYLTNAIVSSPAIVEPFINGTSLGAGVSAAGFYADGNNAHKWQMFTFNWNSGASTTADIQLRDQQSTGSGNDFGLDTVALNAVPEPSCFVLLGGTAAVLAFFRRRPALA